MGPLITCLVVDDDADDQEIFSMAMKEVGSSFNCRFANNALEALDQLRIKEPLPDYIFLDLNMPRLNGMQCLSEIKKQQRLRHIPVVIYSTSSDRNFIDKALKLGAAAFITKPLRISDLIRILRDFFRGGDPPPTMSLGC